MNFEWDEEKAESNYKKHGVRFTEAASTFDDPRGFEMLDLYNSAEEERWIRLGVSFRMRLLVLVYCERHLSRKIRIISARAANQIEKTIYEKGHL
ncbi:MAG: BrnT family toxin [Bdellovibrio sp.]|nr:BrnT family toxin [Bdellovibrio sp.]